MADRLYRSRDDRMLAGVAGGVAEALDADPSIIRIAWALLTIFTGGIAFVVYIVMAIVVPEDPGADRHPGAAFAATEPQPDATTTPPPTDPATPGTQPAYWAPDDRAARHAARRARRAAGEPGRGGLLAGAILICIGAFFLIREFVPWFDWNLWWPLGLIALGGLLLVVALRPGRPTD